MKLDMHCHTKEGSPDGKTALLDNITRLKEKGYDGMLITDHNSYKAYRYYKKLKNKPKDFTVLCGIEYDTLDAGHIIIIMPTGMCPRILELRGLPVLFLVELVHRLGGILGPAHPYGEKFLSTFNTRLGKRAQEKLMRRFDFIETYNACEDASANGYAKTMAVKYHLPEIGGSDSHKKDSLGFGYTILQKNVSNETELIRYIKKGCPIRSGGVRYYHTTKQKLGKANNILVYSFWFYNRFMALFRSKPRKTELKKSSLMQQVIYRKVRYITLMGDE